MRGCGRWIEARPHSQSSWQQPISRSPDPAVFVRGDPNADGIVNLADAIFGLNFFFGGGAAATCLDALDSNDDTLTNLADAVYILEWQFADGAQPPAPFPLCGADPTDTDPLGCDSYDTCP